MAEQHLSLANLSGGAAVEMFDAALQQVLDNILDPNTKPTDTREVTLKIKFKPDEDRELVGITICPSVKLGAPVPYVTQAYVGKDGGEAVATEYNPKQLHMQNLMDKDTREHSDKVVELTRKGGEA